MFLFFILFSTFLVITYSSSLESVVMNILKQEMGGFGRIPSGFSDRDGYLPLHLRQKKISSQLWNLIETGYAKL